MLRTHLIRLNPTPEQEVYFRKACGTARFVFNWALARWKDYRAQGQRVSIHALKVEFNGLKGDQFPWVYDVTKCAAEQAFTNLGAAIAHYFRMKSVIGIEDLNVRGMLQNHRLAQAVSGASFFEIGRQLTYKAAWQGGVVQYVDRFFPSSKPHHGCGGYKPDLDLMDRVWVCPQCGERVDRDLNAARNLRDEAIRLMAVPVVATSGR